MLEQEYTLVNYWDESVPLEIEKKWCMTNVSFELLISLRCSAATKVGELRAEQLRQDVARYLKHRI